MHCKLGHKYPVLMSIDPCNIVHIFLMKLGYVCFIFVTFTLFLHNYGSLTFHAHQLLFQQHFSQHWQFATIFFNLYYAYTKNKITSAVVLQVVLFILINRPNSHVIDLLNIQEYNRMLTFVLPQNIISYFRYMHFFIDYNFWHKTVIKNLKSHILHYHWLYVIA
jgi:hypothetical protein